MAQQRARRLARRAGEAAVRLVTVDDEQAIADLDTGSLREITARLVEAAEHGDARAVARVLQRLRDEHPWIGEQMARVVAHDVIEGIARLIPATPTPATRVTATTPGSVIALPSTDQRSTP